MSKSSSKLTLQYHSRPKSSSDTTAKRESGLINEVCDWPVSGGDYLTNATDGTRYRKVSKLGKGGFSYCYKVVEELCDEPLVSSNTPNMALASREPPFPQFPTYAAKVFRTRERRKRSKLRQMFAFEAQVHEQLQHENIVRLFAAFKLEESIIADLDSANASSSTSAKISGKNPTVYSLSSSSCVSSDTDNSSTTSTLMNHHRAHCPNSRKPMEIAYTLLMECCVYGDLWTLVKKQPRPCRESEARYVVRQTLNGLEYLHGQGVIHRDLKLGNLLLSAGGIVKLCDFGLSYVTPPHSGAKTGLCGTPNYIAPETLSRDDTPPQPSSDMWSLGVCVYAMLYGTPPFQTKTREKTYSRIRRGKYHFPSSPQILPSTREFIVHLLNIWPEDRLTVAQCRTHPFLSLQAAAETRECCPYAYELDTQSTHGYEKVDAKEPPTSMSATPEASTPWNPQHWITLVSDNSDKWGVFYRMCGGECGFLFRDDTSIYGTRCPLTYTYFELDGTATVCREGALDGLGDLEKKYALVSTFEKSSRSYLPTSTRCDTLAEPHVRALKYTVCGKSRVLLQLSNGSWQMDFKSGAAVLLSSDCKQCVYWNTSPQQDSLATRLVVYNTHELTTHGGRNTSQRNDMVTRVWYAVRQVKEWKQSWIPE